MEIYRERPKPISAELFCRIPNWIFCRNRIVAHFHCRNMLFCILLFCNLQNNWHSAEYSYSADCKHLGFGRSLHSGLYHINYKYLQYYMVWWTKLCTNLTWDILWNPIWEEREKKPHLSVSCWHSFVFHCIEGEAGFLQHIGSTACQMKAWNHWSEMSMNIFLLTVAYLEK